MTVRTLARLEDGNWRFDLVVHGERHEGLDIGQAFALLDRQPHFSHQRAHTVIRLAQMGAACRN